MDKVKAKIIELVSDVEVVEPGDPYAGDVYTTLRPITLADVLRAIDKSTGVMVSITVTGEIRVHDGVPTTSQWDLTTDYDGQTQEVKDFIGTLLAVNEK